MEKSGMIEKCLHCVALFAIIFLSAPSAYAVSTSLVSVTNQGIQGNWWSLYPAISADGRYVAFGSIATNLVQDDTNGYQDIFVADRITGNVKRVSVSSSGTQGNGESSIPAISADGRYVAFASFADNLVPGDTNNASDIFVHDQTTGMTERVSNGTMAYSKFTITADGQFIVFTNKDYDLVIYDRLTGTSEFANVKNDGVKMKYGGHHPAISSDGRFLAFQSTASDTEPYSEALFVRDRVNRTTQRVRVFVRNRDWYMGVNSLNISDDGRYLAFSSTDWTIVPDDTNGYSDVFVQDIIESTTERVSVSSSGVQGNSASAHSSMSADGRYIVFYSSANNLILGDNNSTEDIFIHDRATQITEVISISSNGVQGNSNSGQPAISADGRYIAFYSPSNNLVPCDRNGWQDIFVHDRYGAPTDYNGCGLRNNPPVANAGFDQIVSCSLSDATGVTLDGSRSSDTDNDPITYTWSWTGGSAFGVNPTITLPPGITTITLIVNDGKVDSLPATIKVTVQDTTPPVTILQSIAGIPGNNGWFTSSVTVATETTDNCSGVKDTRYSLDGAVETVVGGNSASISITAEGTHTFTYYAVDNAGQIEMQHSFVFHIDKTPPSIVATASSTPNANGWNNTDITVTFVCADATSGVASCNGPITVTTEGANQVITGTAVDNAGNSANTSVTLNIDKTAPLVNNTATPNILWPPNHKMVNVLVGGSASDAGSDIASVVINVTDEYGIYNMTVSGFGSTIRLEASRKGKDKDGRLYTITAIVTDKSGNQSTATTTVLVPHDKGDEDKNDEHEDDEHEDD